MMRIPLYLVLWAVATFGLIWVTVSESWSQLGADPSAMAWVGFLPYLVPLFMVEVLQYLLPAIATIELLLLIRRIKSQI